MELQIIEQSLPIIKFNKEELVKQAQGLTNKYKRLVLVEENFADFKKARAENNKNRKAFISASKSAIEKITSPVKDIQKDFDDVLTYFNEIETHMKEQVDNFIAERKRKKKIDVEALIVATTESYNLDEKHAAQLTLTDKYLNEGMDLKEVEVDLKNRAETLKIAQDTIAKNQQMVNEACEMYKERFEINPKPYLDLLEMGQDAPKVVNQIHELARGIINEQQKQKQAEERRKQEAELEVQRQKMLEEQEAERQKMQAEFDQKQAELQKKVEEPVPEPTVRTEPMKLAPEVKNAPKHTYKLTFENAQNEMISIIDLMLHTGIEFEFDMKVVGAKTQLKLLGDHLKRLKSVNGIGYEFEKITTLEEVI